MTDPIQHNDDVSRNSPEFSSDSARFTTVAQNTAFIWDLRTGRPAARPLTHFERILFAGFSPDGRRLVTTSVDGLVIVWNAHTGLQTSEPFRHGDRVERAVFSFDGRWLATTCVDGRARLWEVLSCPSPPPPWLADLAEAVAGQRTVTLGQFEPVAADWIVGIRQLATVGQDGGPFTLWARWFFAPSGTRTLSPSSPLTVADYVQRRMAEDTLVSLLEAVELSPANALALANLAKAVLASDLRGNPERAGEADFLSRRAVSLAPNDAEVLKIRAEITKQLAAQSKR